MVEAVQVFVWSRSESVRTKKNIHKNKIQTGICKTSCPENIQMFIRIFYEMKKKIDAFQWKIYFEFSTDHE